jgi:tyrosine-protein kinase Etk/Wzc
MLNLLAIPLSRWRTIIAFVGAALLLAVAWLVVRPERYVARTVLMPSPEVGASRSSLSQLLTQELALDLGGLVPVNREISAVAILESRSVADSVVAQLGLDDGWKVSAEQARAILRGRTSLERKEDGTLTVHVEDADPALAAKIANAYPEALNSANARIAAQAALQRRQFLEDQLAQVRGDLLEAEANLLEFQRAHGIPVLEAQAGEAIETAAELQGQIMVREVEVVQLRRTQTSENPQLRAAQAELAALRGQLAGILSGRSSDVRPLPSLSEAPELQMTYASLVRDLRNSEQVYLALTAASTEAGLRGSSNLPIVAVLDPALPSQERAGLSPLMLMVVVVGSATLMGIVVAFTVEWLSTARQDPENQPFFRAWENLRRDLTRGRWR